MSVVECPKPTFHDATVPVRYAIDDQIVIQAPHTCDHDPDVWIPLIPDTPFQRLLDLSIEANCVRSVARDAEFGNQMLHTRADHAQGWPLQIQLRYHVERLPVFQNLHLGCASPLATPALFARHLGTEQFVEVSIGRARWPRRL